MTAQVGPRRASRPAGSGELTARQRDVLLTYARTGSYAAAAHELGLSPHTVKAALVTIRGRLGVESTVQAVLRVIGAR